MKRLVSTYRIQLNPRFGFRETAAVAGYLAELGITDLYLSPPFEARPGSEHGYDLVDHNALRAELGGDDGYRALCETLRENDLGQLVDFVPNHMGVGPGNAWWMDVLENGPASVYASYFDIDWRPWKDSLEHKLLVPILGDQYGAVLERGELVLSREGGAFVLSYYDHRLPIAPRAVPFILAHRFDALVEKLGAADVHLQELQSIMSALEKLAPRYETDQANVTERAREKEVAKRRLAVIFDASDEIRAHIDENLRAINGTPGDPPSFDLLHELLERQAYRLADWRVAGEEINYRRFFDINALAAIRMEDERVFDEAHRLLFRLVEEGAVTGLRIDHPDGLYAPTDYFRRLAERAPQPLPVIVEKILEPGEPMPAAWQVAGTTGYEFLACVNGLYVRAESRDAFDRLYEAQLGQRVDYAELVYDKKKLVMSSLMAGEIRMLAHRLDAISESDRRTRDFTLGQLERALVEYVACLPIYRTYVACTEEPCIDERDRRYIVSTLGRARRRAGSLNASLFDFLRDVLLLVHPDEARLELVRKLQQVTGPVTAKAIEDTTFYIYNRLVSLNEVGSDPREFGGSVRALHALNAERLRRWPGSLNTTATHDTKRGEDTRLRISALSEVPAEWTRRVARLRQTCARFKHDLDGAPAPDANDEILLYQTLVAVWPDRGTPDEELQARVEAYTDKALKEAKVHTSWTAPDEAYEAAARAFARAALVSPEVRAELEPLLRPVAHAARLSSLSQVALKLASPGVTDVYQGCELWDLSLVDPDNRRPVDFARRRELLRALNERIDRGDRAALARELSASLADGRAKLHLLSQGLHLRRREPALFLDGEYLPIQVTGDDADHVIAFARRHGPKIALCVAPRLVLTLLSRSNGRLRCRARLTLPPELRAPFVDVVTGRRHPASETLEVDALWSDFPVALLLNS